MQREQNDNVVVITVDDDEMKLFIRKVYLYAISFILTTSCIWLIISITEYNFNRDVPVPFFVWLMLAFSFMVILQCCPNTRYIFPINWTLAIGIIVFITLAGACIMHVYSPLTVAIVLTAAGLVVILLHLFGALCPRKALPSSLITGCLMLVLLVALIVFMVLMLFIESPVYALVFFILLFCVICLSIPYHAQFINGRLQIVPLLDMLWCALTIYIDFFMLFYCIAFFYIFYFQVNNQSAD
ncbi:GH13867 [Drosophila grimshawi]|uniref:GH13867 n=2 Tax=Drosophila grimshawi TaxID=7222 RepID=B4JP44_DROGR|nr:GH13867 [Drosophila grimshawi]